LRGHALLNQEFVDCLRRFFRDVNHDRSFDRTASTKLDESPLATLRATMRAKYASDH
jgi:hypothetical protein